MFMKSYSSIKAIAKFLLVETLTAEVYILDAYCAGAPISTEKLASELNVQNPLIDRIAGHIEDGVPTLRQIKDGLDAEVLAAMIRDELDKYKTYCSIGFIQFIGNSIHTAFK